MGLVVACVSLKAFEGMDINGPKNLTLVCKEDAAVPLDLVFYPVRKVGTFQFKVNCKLAD
jgi:hypothetical protein